MKKFIMKITNSSFFTGMASIFCPSVIKIEPVKRDTETVSENIAEYWNQLGRYMTNAYGKLGK